MLPHMFSDEQRKKVSALRIALDALKSDPDLFWKATAPLILAGVEAADVDKALEIIERKIQDGDISGAITSVRRVLSWKADLALRVAEIREELGDITSRPEDGEKPVSGPVVRVN